MGEEYSILSLKSSVMGYFAGAGELCQELLLEPILFIKSSVCAILIDSRFCNDVTYF